LAPKTCAALTARGGRELIAAMQRDRVNGSPEQDFAKVFCGFAKKSCYTPTH